MAHAIPPQLSKLAKQALEHGQPASRSPTAPLNRAIDQDNEVGIIICSLLLTLAYFNYYSLVTPPDAHHFRFAPAAHVDMTKVIMTMA